MTGFSMRRALLAALVATSYAEGDAGAQAVALHGGARMYDEGSKVMVALRTEFPVTGPLLVEFSGSVADGLREAQRSATSLFEAQLQLAVPLGDVLTPYLGAGIGYAQTYTFGAEGDDGGTVLSLGAGVRIAFSEQLGLVVDARMRDFSKAQGDEHTDVSVGLRYQFRPTDRPRFRGAPRTGR